MGLGETALVAAIAFHALNGIRIILIDFWSKGAKYQKVMFWTVIVLWVVLMLGFAPVQLHNVFTEGSAS
jgi:succinate dehydrogenase / fumarate reductase cytochrome b subunit